MDDAERGNRADPPERERRCRPPIDLERTLRMYVAQQCFGLPDKGVEDATYDSQAIRSFVGTDLSRGNAPDATTLLKFRLLLKKQKLTGRIFQSINEHLAAKEPTPREGTVVDASIVAAPRRQRTRTARAIRRCTRRGRRTSGTSE